MLTQNTLEELSRIKSELDILSSKITSRAKQLDTDVITVRNDPVVTDLWHSLCSHHRKAMLLCTGLGKDRPEVCMSLEKPQACVEALHLSEEEICCEVFKRRIKSGRPEPEKVKFLMCSPVITIERKSNAAEATRLMKKHGIGSVVVVDKEKIVGIVTERDLVSKVYAKLRDPTDTTVQAIMTKRLVTVDPENDIKSVLKLMSKHNVKHIPVVQDGKLLVGMIAVPDFYRE